MEVIAEEHTLRATCANVRNGWGIRQNLFPVRRECHYRLNGSHDVRHSIQRGPRHKDWLRGKQVGASLPHQLRQARGTEFSIERGRQRRWIQAQAEAIAVEPLEGGQFAV
jgi:hypothetical protein